MKDDTTIRSVQRYWDNHPIATDSAPGGISPEGIATLYERYKRASTPERDRFLRDCKGNRVLEIGCGTALEGRAIVEHGGRYCGVDLSRESLGIASRHFRMVDLNPTGLANANALALPFPDESFDMVSSIGVLHHVPDTRGACREAVRVLRRGGRIRVMLYARDSWHVAFVRWLMAPLVWTLMRVPGGDRIGPDKIRQMVRIARRHGFSTKRLLDVSTDTSFPGEGHFNPHSSFWTERDLEGLFPGVEITSVSRRNLRAWPFPWRRWAERRWGFFMAMDGVRR